MSIRERMSRAHEEMRNDTTLTFRDKLQSQAEYFLRESAYDLMKMRKDIDGMKNAAEECYPGSSEQLEDSYQKMVQQHKQIQKMYQSINTADEDE